MYSTLQHQHGYLLFPSTECTLHYLWIKMFGEIYRSFFFSQDNPVSKLWSKAGGEYSQSDCPNKQPGVYSMALWCHLTTLHYGHMEDDKRSHFQATRNVVHCPGIMRIFPTCSGKTLHSGKLSSTANETWQQWTSYMFEKQSLKHSEFTW